MTLPALTLDDILKLVQIAFYVVGITIATLTYISAKKGLLNTVNTEYQKRVIDRLKELSDELWSEFDPGSPNYWANHNSVKEQVSEINKEFLANRDEILKEGKFSAGIPSSHEEMRTHRLLCTVKTDPFLPKKIRLRVVEFLEKRESAILDVQFDELRKYAGELAQGRLTSPKELDYNFNWVQNRIVDRLHGLRFGVSEVEKQVGEIRTAIQAYLESFNPLMKYLGSVQPEPLATP